MGVYEKKELCSGCEACAQKCPQKCIELKMDCEGFRYPVIDESRCIHCKLCVEICPISNARLKDREFERKVYAAYDVDVDGRKKASSGGVFGLLANQILEQGGVVFGAAFSEDYKKVQHVVVTSKNELSRLFGAKYVQSEIGDAYIQAQNYLEQGRVVLFSGTPCQIGGLQAFLGKQYEHLLCVDIICHGVPSHKVWELWLSHYEVEQKAKIVKVDFRDKTAGWQKNVCHLIFDNANEIRANNKQELYVLNFIKNNTLRPSCYACSFKGMERDSDITLGDFWGIEKVVPEMDADYGVSALVIHSAKGEDYLHQTEQKMCIKEVKEKDILQYNSMITESVPISNKRSYVMANLEEESIHKILKKAVKISFMKRCVIKITSIVRGLRNN